MNIADLGHHFPTFPLGRWALLKLIVQKGRLVQIMGQREIKDRHDVTVHAFWIHADRVYCGYGGRCEASVSRLCGMLGVDVWFEQVKSRVGPEMKQDLLLFSWS